MSECLLACLPDKPHSTHGKHSSKPGRHSNYGRYTSECKYCRGCTCHSSLADKPIFSFNQPHASPNIFSHGQTVDSRACSYILGSSLYSDFLQPHHNEDISYILPLISFPSISSPSLSNFTDEAKWRPRPGETYGKTFHFIDLFQFLAKSLNFVVVHEAT